MLTSDTPAVPGYTANDLLLSSNLKASVATIINYITQKPEMVLNGNKTVCPEANPCPDCPEANSSAVPHPRKEEVLLQRPNVLSTN